MDEPSPRPTRHPALRTGLFVLGVVLVLVTPAIGILPGPGGIFVFAAGLALILQNSRWAKRQFARAKRRWPKLGEYADRGLRRPSVQRRREREIALGLREPPQPLFKRLRLALVDLLLLTLGGDRAR